MERIYLTAIGGVVLIVIVVFLLLHKRIVGARGKISLKERTIEGEIEAIPPEPAELRLKPKPHPPTPSGIRENVQIGSPIIRVLRGISVFRNLQIGRGRIEVVEGKSAGGTEGIDDPHPHRPQR